MRLTAPAPFAEIALATVITSFRPAPVLMVKLWLAAPPPTLFRPMPPAPITIVSVPFPPTTEMPAKAGIVARFTVIVSEGESMVIPGMDVFVEIVPAVLAAVIVSCLEAAL